MPVYPQLFCLPFSYNYKDACWCGCFCWDSFHTHFFFFLSHSLQRFPDWLIDPDEVQEGRAFNQLGLRLHEIDDVGQFQVLGKRETQGAGPVVKEGGLVLFRSSAREGIKEEIQ